MSKTWEHYSDAARHRELAAHHYLEAARYDQAEEHEKAAHHAYLAPGTVKTQFIMMPRLRNVMRTNARKSHWSRPTQVQEKVPLDRWDLL